MDAGGYNDWCARMGASHAHCPYDCEHPQPFQTADGVLYCGRCLAKEGVLTEMIPCFPETCEVAT